MVLKELIDGLLGTVLGSSTMFISPSPLGTNWGYELGWTGMGLGLRGFETKGLGTGLDNISRTDGHEHTHRLTS